MRKFIVILGLLVSFGSFAEEKIICREVDHNRTESMINPKLQKELLPAVKRKDIDKIKELISHPDVKVNCDFDYNNSNNIYPGAIFSYVIETQDLNFVKQFVGFNPNLIINYKELDGELTPLELAIFNKDYDIARYLLEEGASYNIGNNFGCTLVCSLAYEKDEETVNFLKDLVLKHGANVDTIDKSGVNPLYIASHSNNLEAVKVLLEAGSNITFASSKYRKTVIDKLVEEDKLQEVNPEIIHLLEQAEEEQIHRNSKGK